MPFRRCSTSEARSNLSGFEESLGTRPADQDLSRPMVGFLGGVDLPLDKDSITIGSEAEAANQRGVLARAQESCSMVSVRKTA